MKKDIVTKLMIVFLVVFVGFFGYLFLSSNRKKTATKKVDQAVTELIKETSAKPTDATTEPTAETETEEDWTFTFTKETWNALKSVNSDFVAYLCWDDFSLMQPVVQEYSSGEYLQKDFYGGYAGFGAIYIASDNSFTDQNTVLYGHNVIGDSTLMFSPIARMVSTGNIEYSRTFTLFTENEIQHYECQYAYETDAAVNSQFTTYELNDANIDGYKNFNASVNIMQSGEVCQSDKLITFVTCVTDDDADTNRYIVIAKLIHSEPYGE